MSHPGSAIPKVFFGDPGDPPLLGKIGWDTKYNFAADIVW